MLLHHSASKGCAYSTDKQARARAGSPLNDTGAKHSITHSAGFYILVCCNKISMLCIPHHTIHLFTSLMSKSGMKYYSVCQIVESETFSSPFAEFGSQPSLFQLLGMRKSHKAISSLAKFYCSSQIFWQVCYI